MEGTKMDNVFLTFAFGIFILGSCSARVVTVSPGPLIRVEDQPVSIRCEVNEYSGPREQDFEWMMTRDSSGVRIKIISTFDTSYSHPSLSKRVASGDISVVRLEDNEVELKIGEVKSQDAGLYWCQTPSTDSVISGNYEAQVQLIVIPNTLSVSPKILPQEVPEGSDITLSCNVTRVLTHPTYLSVTWAFKSGTTSEEVLTFGPQGDVRTGAKYASRYSEGGIRLVPGRNGLFTLVISRVTTSDSGTYECIGKEWTHENKGTWIKIVENKKEMGAVTVIPTVDSLAVKATSSLSSSSKALLSPGDTLALLCSVTANNLQTLALEVTWLANDRNIITIDQSGVVNSNFSSSSEVVEQGKVSLEKTGAGDFRLSVRDVGDGNGGEYSCHVRAFIDTRGKSAGGSDSLNMVAQKKSSPVVVQVSRIMPNYTLTLEPTLIPKTTAEPTELACRVKNITHLPPGDRLGVMWERTALQGSDPKTLQHIGSLDGNGNLQPGLMYSELLKSGMLSLTRIQPDTFMLRILQTQEVDMGHYSCTVSVWSFGSQEDMLKTTEQKSSPVLVRWDIKRSSLNVIAKRVREASVGGATFEMTCSVTTENLGEAGYSVLIQTQESLESSVKTIMTLSPDNVVQHGGATSPNRRDSLVLTKSSPSEFRFRLEGVQLSDRGFYWCDITAWTKQQQGQAWTKATSAESNKVRIDFQETGPSFSIAIHSDDTNVYPSTTTKIKCSLDVSSSSSKTGDLAYEVLWFFTRLRGGQTTAQLASVDRFGIVKTEMRNSSSEISVERIDAHTYLLNIFGTQDGDSGEYFCTATPWYLSASTGAWTQAEVLTSSRVFLTVQFAVWNSLKLPLLYGAAASLGVGLFSLILGLVCAQCCCRNIAHTPRSRNKLMDLEMD